MNGKVKENLAAAVENPYLWRNVLAIIGMASLLLPWAKLDGAASALSGADMIAYLFSGAERWEMLRTSPLGAMAFLLAPAFALALTGLVFLKTIRGIDSFILNVVAALAPVPIVLFSGGIASSDIGMAHGMMAPQAGMVVLFLSQAGIVAVGVVPWTKVLDFGKRTRVKATAVGPDSCPDGAGRGDRRQPVRSARSPAAGRDNDRREYGGNDIRRGARNSWAGQVSLSQSRPRRGRG